MHVSQVEIRESLTHDENASIMARKSRKLLMIRNKKNLS